jgi:hypothetical protein
MEGYFSRYFEQPWHRLVNYFAVFVLVEVELAWVVLVLVRALEVVHKVL